MTLSRHSKLPATLSRPVPDANRMEDDTIVAISTPNGRGALGVVRLSGGDAKSIVQALCPDATDFVARRATVAAVRGRATGVVDQTVISYFRAPHSYTGEDVAEISCHGSPLVLDRVVEECLALGARSARPGEFTLRAFLNGRVDLTQAEAVIDLVEARTDAGLSLALRQLKGELSSRIEPLRVALLDLLAHITALVDFSEEDIPEIAAAEVRQKLCDVATEVESLYRGAHQGQVVQHGVSLVIAGAPNTGKSSILNALLGRDRAIVTPLSGTTRDTLEEELTIEGILFRVIDTAGITNTENPVEKIGVKRSKDAIEAADIVLLVLDRTRNLNEQDTDVLSLANEAAKETVVAINKSDLEGCLEEELGVQEMGDRLSIKGSPEFFASKWAVVRTSAVTRAGFDDLGSALARLALHGPMPDGLVVSNQRQVEALRRTVDALERASVAQSDGLPMDFIAIDVREAVQSLGEILGIGIGDEVLDRVFSRFCIGK